VSLPINTILHGKCLEVLKTIEDDSVDSIVTDVPYGLGNKDPSVEEIIAYLQGSSLDVGGEFMNKDWELPSVLVWRECFRVLKPGGFLLSFAGTRTQDLISIGIRAAGFENRDLIDAEMGPPILRWVRAQGMPKSTDISKAIDKKFGAEREVIGTKKGVGGENINDLVRGGERVRSTTDPGGKGVGAYGTGAKQVSVDIPVTAPATDAAKEWSGWGTALKPYWEPILMFRKPVRESTVVGQVLKTGTGGINIDGCRVKHSSPEDFAKHKAGVDAIKAKGGSMANSWKNSSDLSGANEVTSAGRFPPNVIIVHSDLCRKIGTESASMPPINRFDDGAKPFGGGAGHQYTTVERGDEVITLWKCHHSCPVYHLNKFNEEASRFFYNVDPGSLLFYVPKPSANEKNDGLEDDEENEHSTVKPVRLMEYLVRLVTRKGGVVLDPYCGSGTTCVAAVNEGMDFIGIEKELPSVKTAQARTAKVLRERSERESQKEAFDFSMSLESD